MKKKRHCSHAPENTELESANVDAGQMSATFKRVCLCGAYRYEVRSGPHTPVKTGEWYYPERMV